MALPDWRDVALNGRRVVIAFDGDVARKESVQKAARGLGRLPGDQGCARRVPASARHRPTRPGWTTTSWPATPSRTCGGWSSRTPPSGRRSHRHSRRPPPQPKPPAGATDLARRGARRVPPLARRGLRHRRAGRRARRRRGREVRRRQRPGLAADHLRARQRQDRDRAGTRRRRRHHHQLDHRRGRAAVRDPEAGTRQGRHRRAAAQDRRARGAGHQGRHVDPVDEQRHPRQGARRAARDLRRPLVPRGRRPTAGTPSNGADASPSSARSPPRGTPTTPSSPPWATGSSSSASTPPRPAGSRSAGHRATPATRRRCAPSWPRRSAASSPG